MRVTYNKKVCAVVGSFLVIIIVKYFRPQVPIWDLQFAEIDVETANKRHESHERWIVVTSIQKPTKAIQQLAQIDGWKMVVVGDRKSPDHWMLPGVTYLSTSVQKTLDYRITSLLPYDSYTRKLIGYLYAIQNGAQYIYETDDDNYIHSLDAFTSQQSTHRALVPITVNNTFNPYPHFGQTSMWPRGYPLENIGLPQPRRYHLCSVPTPVIQQGLVDGHPDVDAIFRMTRQPTGVDTRLMFDAAAPSVVISHGVYAPFNSQNTFFSRNAFWALFLFTTVSDRESDIYRAYWAQRLLHMSGYSLAFHAPTSRQVRNAWHTHRKDARAETRLYTQMGTLVEYLHGWTCSRVFFFDCMLELTSDLVTRGYVEDRDAKLMSAWIDDLASVGYSPPLIRDVKKTCKVSDVIDDVIYYPWEQNTSMAFTNSHAIALMTNDGNTNGFDYERIDAICGPKAVLHLTKTLPTAAKYDDVLLVISISGDTQIIPVLNALYRIHFPHILYCGVSTLARNDANAWKVTYVKVTKADVLECVTVASDMQYNVAGYLHVTQNHFVKYENLHVGARSKDHVWVSGSDLYIFNDVTLNLCGTQQLQCSSLSKDVFKTVNAKLSALYPNAARIQDYTKCLAKAGEDPTLKSHDVIASKELVFYLSKTKVKLFSDLASLFMKDTYLNSYGFLSLLVMECMEVAPEYLHAGNIADHVSSEDQSHYDYLFPFVFANLESDLALQHEYCKYIEGQ